MPMKVKLDKSDLAELREYRTNKKSTRFQPLGFKLGACGGEAACQIELLISKQHRFAVVNRKLR